MSCSSTCRNPGTHQTYGECLRAKNLRIGSVNASEQKKVDKQLDEYAKARKYGIQPKTTRAADVRQAVAISEQTGTAYQA